jgi:hypothetical protein
MNFISFHSYLFDFMSILWFSLLFNTVINPNCHKDKNLSEYITSEYITRERDQRGSALTPYRYQIGFVAPISYYHFAACSSPSPENKKLPSMGAYSYLSKRETRLPTGKTET